MAVIGENLGEDSEEKGEKGAEDMEEVEVRENIEVMGETEETLEKGVENGLSRDRADQAMGVQVGAEVIIIDRKKHQIQEVLDEEIERNIGDIKRKDIDSIFIER